VKGEVRGVVVAQAERTAALGVEVCDAVGDRTTRSDVGQAGQL